MIQFQEVPNCSPLEELKKLLTEGRLKRSNKVFGKRHGDCHGMALALVEDIADAYGDLIQRPWIWYHADVEFVGYSFCGEHSWVECDGWVIDASNGRSEGPVRFMRAKQYRRENKDFRNIKSMWDKL